MLTLETLFHPCDRVFDLQKAVRGLFAGAAAGGLLTTLTMTIGILPLSAPVLPEEWPHAAITAFGFFLWSDILASFAWLAGLIIVAVPAWSVLSAVGVRCWSAATLLGAVLAPAPFILVEADNWAGIAAFSVIGAIVGLLIWLIAYPAAERA